jgi:UDP-glucose:(heptosyl)LPS alpha-1,3-glucosyltransferase
VRVALVHPRVGLETSVERNAAFLARGLAGLGVDVHWFCDRLREVPEAEGVELHELGALSPPAPGRVRFPLERGSFALRATSAIRRLRDRFDVVDVRQTAAWELDVLTVHGVVAAMQRRWPEQTGRDRRAARLRAALAPVLRPQVALDRSIQRLQLRPGRYARVIAEAKLVRDDLVEVHDVPSELIDVIPPPMNLEPFATGQPDGVRASLRIGADDPFVLFVGHDFERKGLQESIGAVAAVPDAHLVVVGSGDERSYAAAARRAGLGSRIHFVGATSTPERFYHEADVLLLPTRQDNWGAPLVEAMAAGLAVVSTEAAGAAGAVKQAGAGVILPDSSAPELRAAVAGMLADPGRRRAMGERGRRAAERFGIEAHSRAVLDVYERTLPSIAARRARRKRTP